MGTGPTPRRWPDDSFELRVVMDVANLFTVSPGDDDDTDEKTIIPAGSSGVPGFGLQEEDGDKSLVSGVSQEHLLQVSFGFICFALLIYLFQLPCEEHKKEKRSRSIFLKYSGFD